MNIKIFEFLNNLAGQNSALDSIVVFFATYFGIAIILFTIFFLFFHRHEEFEERAGTVFKQRVKEALLILISAGAAWLLAYFAKNLLALPRPIFVLDNVNLLFEHGGWDSFPSGHAAFFAALATALYMRHPRIGFYYAIFAVVIGLSRVIAGVHFPFDILGGFILGILTVWIIDRLGQLRETKKEI